MRVFHTLMLCAFLGACGHWGNVDYSLSSDISVIDKSEHISQEDYQHALEAFLWETVAADLYASYDDAVEAIRGMTMVVEKKVFKCVLRDPDTGEAVDRICSGIALPTGNFIRITDREQSCVAKTSFIHELAHMVSFDLYEEGDGDHSRELFWGREGLVTITNLYLAAELESCED